MAENFTSEQAKVVDALLLEAVEACDYQRINLCLQKGADIDARNTSGRTPLMMAVWHENPQMTQFLLAKNPSLFLKDNNQKTAFDLISEVRGAAERASITNILLNALPDHARHAATPAEAAKLAEAAAKKGAPVDDVATGADITVSKPIALPGRANPKGFSL